jgi:hypothetical protein
MKCLNTKAKLVAQKLYEAMYSGPHMKHEGYAKIDTSEFMAVSVEFIGEIPGYGNVISVAHYGVQNGDLMADPEMTFVIVQGDYYPISFRNDYLGINQEVFRYKDGKPTHIKPKLQSDLTTFANSWMKNIQEQQKI